MQTRVHNESQTTGRRYPDPQAGFLRCWNVPGLLPHLSSLPLVEGAPQSITERSKSPGLSADRKPFSLARRERIGVREKLQLPRAGHSCSRTSGCLRRDKAFTLIEMMVAVSIMVVIVFALYQVFNQTQRALRANITQVDVLESGRAALEMITRELEQLNASDLLGATNFYAGLFPAVPLIQTDLDGTKVLRTNVLQEFFFLSSVTNRWVGTGYRVLGADGGVGTLYRFSTSTNSHLLTFRNLSGEFATLNTTNPVTRTISTNFHRVADGIIHLRLLAYDPTGRRLGFETTNFYPAYSILRQNSRLQQLPLSNNRAAGQSPNVILRQEVAGETKLLFLDAALPAYIEIELGVVEPATLAQYESMRGGSGQTAKDFLKKRATKVHLFRQRIPIRTASQ